MKSKTINKLLNKVIILLLIAIIGIYGKQEISKSYAHSEDKKTLIKSNLDIYYFDVGQADSILINNNNDTILIDAGNNNDGKNLVKYIKSLNIKDIDIAIGTHPHEDHIGGLDEIIDSFDIGTIYMPDVTTTTKSFENVLDSLEEKKLNITIPKIDETIKLGNINIKILYTGTNKNDLNDTSIVLKITYYNNTFLFTGDATKKVEKKLLNKDINSDVLKIGHHGSNYSSSLEFLKAVNPKYSVISVGKDNIYKHPSLETINNLNDLKINIYRTDQDGTIKVISNGNKIKIEKIKTKIDG